MQYNPIVATTQSITKQHYTTFYKSRKRKASSWKIYKSRDRNYKVSVLADNSIFKPKALGYPTSPGWNILKV
jgi:hypothetical protein